jgi:hypothetical protein
MPQTRIRDLTGYSLSQIRHAIRSESAVIQPRSERPREMAPEQEQELIDFVCAPKRNR